MKDFIRKIDKVIICIFCAFSLLCCVVALIMVKEKKEKVTYTEADKGNYEFSDNELSMNNWKYRIVFDDENAYGRYLYLNNKFNIFGVTDDITHRKYILIDMDNLYIKIIDGTLWMEKENDILITTNFSLSNSW